MKPAHEAALAALTTASIAVDEPGDEIAADLEAALRASIAPALSECGWEGFAAAMTSVAFALLDDLSIESGLSYPQLLAALRLKIEAVTA